MNILRNNIHMDMVKCRAVSQVTLEDDINLPENCPDLDKIIFSDGNVAITDTKVANDHVTVKGTLNVMVLYLTEDDDEKLARTSGKVPFEENIYMEGVKPGDNVDVNWKIEDLSIGIINSRKISLRSVITFTLQSDYLYDEEAAVDISDADAIEYHSQQMEIARLAICKRDIYRIRQEMELPSNLPNFFRVIWQSVRISTLDFKPLDEKISINGELSIFVLYESPQDDDNIRYYETTLPFSGSIECHGSREMMIPDIKWTISSREFEVRPDFDGEERGFSLEMVLDLCIKLYEEEQIGILSDVYGTQNEVTAEVNKGKFRRILVRNNGKCRVNEKLKVDSNAKILQLIHCEGEAYTEDVRMEDNGVQIEGIVNLKCLYVTSDDKMPYASLEQSVPFSYLLEAKGAKKDCIANINVSLEQMQVNMLDAQELEAKILLDVAGILFEEFEQDLVTDVNVQQLDKTKWKSLPGIVVHIVQDGDTLWQIGKKYYMPVAQIKELNELSSEHLKTGEKLLLVKDMK